MLNTDLRTMIDNALSGDHEDQVITDSPMVNPEEGHSDDVIKLAHALNHVAVNVHDIGSAQEKLAELEAFQARLGVDDFDDLDDLDKEAAMMFFPKFRVNRALKGLEKAKAANDTEAIAKYTEKLKGFGEKGIKDQDVAAQVSKALDNRNPVLRHLQDNAGGYAAGAIGVGGLGYAMSKSSSLLGLGAAQDGGQTLEDARHRAMYKLAEAHGMSYEEYEAFVKEAGPRWDAVKAFGSNLAKDTKAGFSGVRKGYQKGVAGHVKNLGAMEAELAKIQKKLFKLRPAAGAPVDPKNVAKIKELEAKSTQLINRLNRAEAIGGAPAGVLGAFKGFGKGFGKSRGARASAAETASAKEPGAIARHFEDHGMKYLAGAGVLGAGGVAASALSNKKAQGNSALKYASLNKVAEDRINPARIRAGKADPFSGFPRRALSPILGKDEDFIRMKAQQVRDRINSDMRSYVDETGSGYNLERYLDRFNK